MYMYKYSIPPRFQLITIDYVIFLFSCMNKMLYFFYFFFLLFNEIFFTYMLLFLFSYSSIHSRIIHMHIRSLTINVHLWTKSSTQFHKIIISFSLVFISIYFQKLLKRIKIFFTFKLL